MHDNILNGTGLTGVPSPVNPAGGLPVSEFAPLIKITTNAATPFEESYVNIEANIKLHYPRLHELPEFMKPKGKDKPIFLVGAGPSLRKKDIFDELMGMYKEGHPIIACGASYDYLVENGVIPAYNSICDPDPITVNYLTKAHKATTFLLSTACAPSVLKRLIGYNIILWHCFSDANAEKFKELEPDFQAVGGGCTVGLRSVSIAIMLGYSNIHFFGFDSCLDDDDKHHAYEFSDDTKEFVGDVYRIKMGFDGPGEKVYRTAGYHIAQADHFRNFFYTYHDYFTPTFHGPGLLPDMFRLIMKKSQENDAIEAAKKQSHVETVGVQL